MIDKREINIFSNESLLHQIKNDLSNYSNPEEYISDIKENLITMFLSNLKIFSFQNIKAFNITIEVLSDLEEIRLDISNLRYNSGSYYSPIHKIEEIFNEMELDISKTFCDNSCGSGNFILFLLNRVSEEVNFDEFHKFLIYNVYAFDINEEAISILMTRIKLLIKIKYNKEFNVKELINIKVMDFLLSNEVLKFDIIIGNPPYLGIKSIKKEYKAKLKEKYGFVDDLYSMFFYKSIDCLSLKGKMYLISSNTWLTISSKSYIREKLLENGLYKIIENNKNTFKIKTVTTTLFLDKGKNRDYINYFNENTEESRDLLIKDANKENGFVFLSSENNETNNLYYLFSKQIHTTKNLSVFCESENFKNNILNNEFVPLGFICYVGTGIDFKGENELIMHSLENKKYRIIEDKTLIESKPSIKEFKEGFESSKVYIKAVKNEENIYLKWDKNTVTFLRKIKAPLRNIDLYGNPMIYCNTTKLLFRSIDENTLCINTAGACFLKPVFIENYLEIRDIILKYLKENDFSKFLKTINNGLSYSPNDIKKIPFEMKLIRHLI